MPCFACKREHALSGIYPPSGPTQIIILLFIWAWICWQISLIFVDTLSPHTQAFLCFSKQTRKIRKEWANLMIQWWHISCHFYKPWQIDQAFLIFLVVVKKNLERPGYKAWWFWNVSIITVKDGHYHIPSDVMTFHKHSIYHAQGVVPYNSIHHHIEFCDCDETGHFWVSCRISI